MKFLIAVLIIFSIFSEVSANRQRRSRRENERDITADEVIEITEDIEIKDDEDELANKAML